MIENGFWIKDNWALQIGEHVLIYFAFNELDLSW